VPAGALLGLAILVGLIALFAPLESAAGALVATWLLVPGTLSLPGLPHLALFVRVPLYALALRMVLAACISRDDWLRLIRPTGVHMALLALLAVGFVDGVALVGQGVSFPGDMHAWLRLLDLAVAFVVVLALARRLGPWRIARLVAGFALFTVVVAAIERATGSGWSHFLFEHLAGEQSSPGASVLATRGGAPRAQVAAEFALEYGWVMVMALPVVTVSALRLRCRLLGLSHSLDQEVPAAPARERGSGHCLHFPYLPAPRIRGFVLWGVVVVPVAAVLAGVVMSGSRSAEVASVLVLGVLGLLVGAGPRAILAGASIMAVLVVAVALGDPHVLLAPFVAAAHTNSVSIRIERLPYVFAAAATHPFTGVGFRGLVATIPGVDDAYALTYATLGVVGLLAWGALAAAFLLSLMRAIRFSRMSSERMLGAACLVGVGAAAVAAGAYDLVVTPESLFVVIVLAAIGTACAEGVVLKNQGVEAGESSGTRVVEHVAPGTHRGRRLLSGGAIGVAVGAVVGAAVLLATPPTWPRPTRWSPSTPLVWHESRGHWATLEAQSSHEVLAGSSPPRRNPAVRPLGASR